MTVHQFPLWPSQMQRLNQRQSVVRINTIADAVNTAHMLVWDAVDHCPDPLALAALRRAEQALTDAALCLHALHHNPEEER